MLLDCFMSHSLSAEEVKALLHHLSIKGKTRALLPAPQQNICRPLELAVEERITRGRLPGIEFIHDRFARSFRQVMSTMLERSCSITIRQVSLPKFGQFTKKLPLPSSIHLFCMTPLSGQAMICFSSQFVDSVVDCMFGGTGARAKRTPGREFSPIESRLIAKAAMLALESLKEAWAPVADLNFVYARNEQNPLVLSIASPSDASVVIEAELELKQGSRQFFLCYPYSLLEPLRPKLTANAVAPALSGNASAARRIARVLLGTSVELRAKLAEGQIKTSELLHLKAGDVIRLDTPADATVIVEAGGRPKFEGHLGTHHGQRAVKVTKALSKKQKSCLGR